MTAETFRTMIVPAAFTAVARAIAAALSPAGAGMFTSGLVPADGPADAEPTDYISTGMIKSQFADLLASGDAAALYAASVAGAQAQGFSVTWTQDDCAALLASSDVSDEPPFVAIERLLLQLQQPVDDMLVEA